MLRMSTGKSTVIEVSVRIPTKESMPMDAMAARVRQGTGESAAGLSVAADGWCRMLSVMMLLAVVVACLMARLSRGAVDGGLSD